MSLQRVPSLYIASSEGKDRGVYTAEPVVSGALIEICPVIVLPPEDRERIHGSLLHDYYFLWEGEGETAIALGYGSLYNHAEPANADYEMDFPGRCIRIIATRNIGAGEEVCIDYTDGVDRSTLWF